MNKYAGSKERDIYSRFNVTVTQEEMRRIQAKANKKALSIAAYLRKIAQEVRPCRLRKRKVDESRTYMVHTYLTYEQKTKLKETAGHREMASLLRYHALRG